MRVCCIWWLCCTTRARAGARAIMRRRAHAWRRACWTRLELDTYESGLVLGLIANHLEMSAALRRDIFDAETVGAFAGKVLTPEMLRMLTLFTYADINAVHPDALTPWKAENLWRLYIATSNYLDRSVDEERVGAQVESELVHRVAALLPGQRAEVGAYLEGFPERYVRTRMPEQVRRHFQMAKQLGEDRVQLDFRYSPSVSEIDGSDAGQGAAVCQYVGCAGGLGDEYCDSGRVFEPAGSGGGQLPVYGHVSYAGDERVGA